MENNLSSKKSYHIRMNSDSYKKASKNVEFRSSRALYKIRADSFDRLPLVKRSANLSSLQTGVDSCADLTLLQKVRLKQSRYDSFLSKKHARVIEVWIFLK